MSRPLRIVLSIFLSFLYSLAYTVVGPMIASQNVVFESSMIFPFLICFILCFFANYLLFTFVPKIKFQAVHEKITRCLDKIGDRKLFFIVWAFIFVAWIPAFLILYPGVLSYDAISQTESAINGITNNHHPVMHTWLIGVFMKFGMDCFSRYEYGIGLLSLLQMIILSYSLTRLVFLLKKKNVHIILVIITALLSAFWFTNAVLSVSMIKDTLHAAFLVLFVCHFAEIVTEPSEYCKKKINFVLLPLVSFFMCAFRNNGFHIYVFSFAFLALLRITRVKKIKSFIPLIAVIILPVVLFKVYSGPMFKTWNIAQGDMREGMCVPIQQLQRVSALKNDELTDEQRDTLESYILDCHDWMGYERNRAYTPFNADPAKGWFYTAQYKSNPVDFWKFYFQIGKQFTKTYIVAFLSNTLDFWYPGHYAFSYVMYNSYDPEKFCVPLYRMSIWDSKVLGPFYNDLCSSVFWRNAPVLRIFFVPGFSTWILLYGLVLSWKKKGFFTKVFPLFLPLIGQYGIMLMCPIASFRYSWPLYLLFPIMLLGVKNNSEKEEGLK